VANDPTRTGVGHALSKQPADRLAIFASRSKRIMRATLGWFRLGDPTSFPVISRLRQFFPLFGGRNFPVAMLVMRGLCVLNI
jgi:hypothetical protein